MATTFDAGFRNQLLGYLSGATTSGGNQFYYANFYNGAQAASPTTTPAGSMVFSTITSGPTPNGKWSAADNNATIFLTTNAAPVTPAGAAGVTSLTTCRIYNNSQTGVMDFPISTTAGSGIGGVVDTLTSTAGVGVTLTSLPVRMPLNNGGTLHISLSLAKRLLDLATNVVSPSAANVPQMGINTNGGCTLTVYGGTVPASADAPLGSATALCSFTIGATQLWSAATGGSLPMAISLTSAAAVATGTATFARMVKTNGSMTYTIQGSAGAAGSDFVIGTTSITSGSTYTMTDCVISL